MSLAYLNGEFRQLQDTRISPLDRGFLFADAVYEAIPACAGRLFHRDAHLHRLERSLAGIRLEDPQAEGVACSEVPVMAAELVRAREIRVSSSTKEVAPVVQLDGVAVGEGTPGPLWERVHGLFQAHKQRLMRPDLA